MPRRLRSFDPSKSQIEPIYKPAPLAISGTDPICFLGVILFLGTGGGHDYSVILDTAQNGIEVDLGYFHTVFIDQTAKTMAISELVHFTNMRGSLSDLGKEICT